MNTIFLIYDLFKVKHYIKNITIFFPVFFAGLIFNKLYLVDCVILFISFSACASSVYIFNDICDLKNDLNHPKKKLRPLATKKISILYAYILSILLLFFSLFFLYLINFNGISFLILYLIMNIFYSLFLKKIPIIDVMVIASGFILRIFAGSEITGVMITPWLLLLIFTLTSFLAFSKRKEDIWIKKKLNLSTRIFFFTYSITFINYIMKILAVFSILIYFIYLQNLYSITKNNYIYISIFFVIFGFWRYYKITNNQNSSTNPVDIFYNDKLLQLNLIMWLLSFYFFIYKPIIL